MAGMLSGTRAKKRRELGGAEQGAMMEHLLTLEYVCRRPAVGWGRG